MVKDNGRGERLESLSARADGKFKFVCERYDKAVVTASEHAGDKCVKLMTVYGDVCFGKRGEKNIACTTAGRAKNDLFANVE